ncbi:hypothetical protein M5E06_17780 [Azospirillum sp. A1-3]|uniref:hypothetical protein n=1 Tax=Azospirillum sp. A1-3 TaxID=185874 RepID=UPI00207776AE|nr:hypothetical protein [Azospirillum sp. A1-3]MCM8735986.1 hypothetical protein [Azospirillum sp. A1-3]
MPALLVSVPDDIQLGRQAIAADAPKPRRKRRMKTKAEWAKFVTKKHGPAAVNEALKKASASRKAANDTRRRTWGRIAKIIQADAEEARALDIKLDKDAGVKVSSVGADKGTAPTRKKMRPDTLLWMLDRGQLSQEAYDAALSIRAAYMLITIGMDARVATYGESFGGRGDTWETAWAVQMQELYNDWCDVMVQRAAAAQKVHRGTRRWQTSLVHDIVIEGMTCAEVGADRGMCRKAVADIFRDALDLYLDIKSGKVRAPTKMAA